VVLLFEKYKLDSVVAFHVNVTAKLTL